MAQQHKISRLSDNGSFVLQHDAFLSDFAAHEARVGEIGTLADELAKRVVIVDTSNEVGRAGAGGQSGGGGPDGVMQAREVGGARSGARNGAWQGCCMGDE